MKIKFRAWDYKEIIMPEDLYIIIDGEEKEVSKVVLNNNGMYSNELMNYELMQYTGLKDKNEKEIYEGDIVKIQTVKVNEDDYIIGTVVYSEYEGMYLTNKGYILGRISHRAEVIGNIYENKDLLK